MILKLILSALLLYYLCVLWKYYRTDIAGKNGCRRKDGRTGRRSGKAG